MVSQLAEIQKQGCLKCQSKDGLHTPVLVAIDGPDLELMVAIKGGDHAIPLVLCSECAQRLTEIFAPQQKEFH